MTQWYEIECKITYTYFFIDTYLIGSCTRFQLKGRITAALKILKEAPELYNTISDDPEDGLDNVLSESVSVMAINNRRLGTGLW